MKLKYIFYGVLILLLIIPSLLYFGSLDWSRQHTKRIANLPEFTDKVDAGQYRLKANGMEFLVRVAGMQNSGEAVILLHGFPESSIMWEALMQKAAKVGYRVLAFDQRGYSPMARPENIQDYHLNELSGDVLTIARKVGFEKFHLVGHDWGAAVGWKTVIDHPENMLTWTALSIPHPAAFFNGVVHDTIQQKRSGYFKFFQKKYLPEFMFTYGGQRTLKKMLANLPKKDLEEYLAILAEPGAVTAELNWYRAMDVEGFAKSKIFEKEVTVPTLFIWGKIDMVIAPTVIEKQKQFIKSPFSSIALEVGHNLMQDREEEVREAVFVHWGNLKNK